jgi:hypothetical protein
MVTAAAVVAERRSGCAISIAAIEAACQSLMLRRSSFSTRLIFARRQEFVALLEGCRPDTDEG